MSSDTATLIAALIAATAATVSTLINILNSRSSAQRDAVRTLLAEEVSEIGNCLYQLVALSKRMTDAGTDEKFNELLRRANDVKDTLNKLRGKNRYALWGLDDGFRTIRWVHSYISHHRHTRSGAAASEIIRQSTSLRLALDKAIMDVYFSGRPPTLRRRIVVRWRAKKLRKFFDDGAPEDSP